MPCVGWLVGAEVVTGQNRFCLLVANYQPGLLKGFPCPHPAVGRPAKINTGKPMPGMVLGRSAGKAGDTANLGGTGALGEAAPGEIGGVERSDVPEEYREQVGRYFQPK